MPVNESQPAVQPERYHGLDAARGLLMALGVLLHAGNVYGVRGEWLVHDPPGARFFDDLVSVLHSFRMPAFFLLSGFFASLTLERQGLALFLGRRVQRLLLPLVAAGLTLNSVQTLLLQRAARPAHEGSVVGQLVASWRDGSWVTHLWFLIALLLYCTVLGAVCATPWVGRGLKRLERATSERELPRWLWIALLAALPAVSVVAWGLAQVLPGATQPLYGPLSGQLLLYYLPFYAVGCATYYVRRARLTPLASPVWIGAAWLLWYLGSRIIASVDVGPLLESWVQLGLPWLASWLVFALFLTFCARPSARLRAFADSTYTIYLFHHLLVIVGAFALIPITWPAALKFTVVCSATLALTVVLHRTVVAPSRLLRLLFNGRG